MLAFPDVNPAGSFGRPPGRLSVAQPHPELAREILPRRRAGRRASASNPPAAGAPRSRSICSLSRRRTSLQSPRFSVMLQSSFRDPSLSAAISAAAASRKDLAASRDSSGSTSRNCPPPLDPSRILARPNSASSARGNTSLNRLIQWERPVKIWSVSFSAGARRNSSIPRSFPIRNIWTDIGRRNHHCITMVGPSTALSLAFVARCSSGCRYAELAVIEGATSPGIEGEIATNRRPHAIQPATPETEIAVSRIQ